MKRFVVLSVLLATLAPSVATAPRATAADAPVVYAHRGGAAIAPENTLGAFRQAHALFGADGVWLELDAQRTSDGELAVIHDATLDRTTPCEGNVIAHTLAQVQLCDASEVRPGWGSFEPVPSLRQVFTEGKAAGWRLMVELKNIPGEPDFDPTGAASATELLTLLDETDFPKSDLLVQSFFPTSLDQIELADPTIRTVLLTTSQLPGAPPGAGFTLAENAAYAVARGYEVSAPDDATLDLRAETVATAHALGRLVVPWTIDTTARAEALAVMGVDGIITNDPAAVYAAINP
ncbi:MAG: hypothetical protein HYU28_01470 [Actinobacteria bacterium]|nr:hypothetical protein [Actinomycetota bacterium]